MEAKESHYQLKSQESLSCSPLGRRRAPGVGTVLEWYKNQVSQTTPWFSILGTWVLAKKEVKSRLKLQEKVYLESHQGRQSEL